jgi:hypothetical protein
MSYTQPKAGWPHGLVFLLILILRAGLLSSSPAQAQLSSDQRASPPGQQKVAPRSGKGHAGRSASSPPGTELPSIAQPADPPSTLGPSSGPPTGPAGNASTNSAPGTPNDPAQAPIGGLGWLAAAGVAYAVRRLQKRSASKI